MPGRAGGGPTRLNFKRSQEEITCGATTTFLKSGYNPAIRKARYLDINALLYFTYINSTPIHKLVQCCFWLNSQADSCVRATDGLRDVLRGADPIPTDRRECLSLFDRPVRDGQPSDSYTSVVSPQRWTAMPNSASMPAFVVKAKSASLADGA
jgi:hypothetical protein